MRLYGAVCISNNDSGEFNSDFFFFFNGPGLQVEFKISKKCLSDDSSSKDFFFFLGGGGVGFFTRRLLVKFKISKKCLYGDSSSKHFFLGGGVGYITRFLHLVLKVVISVKEAKKLLKNPKRSFKNQPKRFHKIM